MSRPLNSMGRGLAPPHMVELSPLISSSAPSVSQEVENEGLQMNPGWRGKPSSYRDQSSPLSLCLHASQRWSRLGRQQMLSYSL